LPYHGPSIDPEVEKRQLARRTDKQPPTSGPESRAGTAGTLPPGNLPVMDMPQVKYRHDPILTPN